MTAGGILAKERISSSFLGEKLLTPMALVRLRFRHSSMPSHTDFMSIGSMCCFGVGNSHTPGLSLNGQCIRNRSRYSSWRFLCRWLRSLNEKEKRKKKKKNMSKLSIYHEPNNITSVSVVGYILLEAHLDGRDNKVSFSEVKT